jgi:predicted transcriptional regulator
MGLFSDLLKEIPTGAVQKERLDALRDQYAALETERDMLKIDLSRAQKRISELEANLAETQKSYATETAPPAELHENAIKILRLFAQESEAFDYDLISGCGLDQVTAEYYLEELEEAGYVRVSVTIMDEGTIYVLEQKGRKWLIEHPQ